MNFKFTKAKGIVSIVVGIILGFFSFIGGTIYFGPRPDNWWITSIINGVVTFVIIFALIYVVWSLIQKKEEIKK